MSETWLISGSPGCGETSWILDTFKKHQGSCGYILLKGFSEDVGTDNTQFVQVGFKSEKRIKGFGRL